MNPKEMQSTIESQRASIMDMTAAIEHIRGDHADSVKSFAAALELNTKWCQELLAQQKAEIVQLHQDSEAHRAAIDEAIGRLNDHARAISKVEAELDGIRAETGRMAGKVDATNRSAPTHRNMTDRDAVAVLEGEQRESAHKEAGEALGLTYAQVYSCRMEYTFKHVHKELRDRGFRNPWAKKTG